MVSPFSAVSIIFNPKSTGASRAKAESLQKSLRKDLPDTPVQLMPTEHTGHAHELAYREALASERPLIISVSGDGGYNEVVNGLMQAKAKGAQATAGLLPAGNANDHYRSLSSGTLEQHIVHGRRRRIDLLHITATVNGTTWERYAHSYVGLGITANVGSKLNEIDLNPINEWLVSARIIYTSPPFSLLIAGKKHSYDSLIFSNIARLGKVFVMSSRSQADDGKFEVVALQSPNKAAMLRRVAQALTAPAEDVVGVEQRRSFSFQTTDTQPMQFDGETTTLTAGTKVTVHCAKQALNCVI